MANNEFWKCCLWRSQTACGVYNDVHTIFTTEQLLSRMNNVEGFPISDYQLIKSRYKYFFDGALFCARHRFVLCEGYEPQRRCAFYGCHDTTNLIQMGVLASLFVRYVPILGYICGYHRAHYEERMYNQNLQPFIVYEGRLPIKWDYIETPIHSNKQYHQPNASLSQTAIHEVNETELNKASQKRRFRRESSLSKSSYLEPMEIQRHIQMKICASPSTIHECERITMVDADTFVMLKNNIIEKFKLGNCSNDFCLMYSTSDTSDTSWKTLKIEDENQTLADLSFGDHYVVTYASSKFTDIKACSLYPLPGLDNLGNTCYMNSALQCLNHVQPFFDYSREAMTNGLLNDKNTGKETTSTLIGLYIKLIDSLCSADDGCIVPAEFHREFGRLASRFFNYHQHDSLEFVNILLDILHEDLISILQQEQTIVSTTFHGQIRTVVTCKQCNKKLQTDDSFSFLPLPIPGENEEVEYARTRRYKLDECFQTFLQREHIGDHGQWYCEHCGELTDANKTLHLKKLPPVLILQLKRFNYDLRSYAKNNTFIEYDLDNLDINQYVVESYRDTSIRYDLIAVSNHWGDLIGGHYITYAKLPGTQDWYKYNDRRVGKMDKKLHETNNSAYILVYQRQEKDATNGTPV